MPSRSTKPKAETRTKFSDRHDAARNIVRALGDISNRTVIEIGPGRGALTSLLIARASA